MLPRHLPTIIWAAVSETVLDEEFDEEVLELEEEGFFELDEEDEELLDELLLELVEDSVE